MNVLRLKHETGETLLMIDKITHIKYDREVGNGTMKIYFGGDSYDSYSNVEEDYYKQVYDYIDRLNEDTPKDGSIENITNGWEL